MRKIIGVILLATPIIAIAIAIVYVYGLVVGMSLLGIGLVGTALIFLGAYLLT